MTYRTPPEFADVLREMADQLPAIVIVSNDDSEEEIRRTEKLVEAVFGPDRTRRVRLCRNGTNRGLSAALNLGADVAKDLGADFLLLLDQDSLLRRGAVRELLSAHSRLDGSVPVGSLTCANEELVSFTGFPFAALERVGAMRQEKWRRRHLGPSGQGVTEIPTLITSGSLLSMETFRATGPFNEHLFLDAIDFDYSFRLRAHGKRLFQVESAKVVHRQGSPFETVILGRRVRLRTYPPVRSFHIVRDTSRMVRTWFGRYPVDVLGIAAHTLVRVTGSLLFLPQRDERARLVLSALSGRPD